MAVVYGLGELFPTRAKSKPSSPPLYARRPVPGETKDIKPKYPLTSPNPLFLTGFLKTSAPWHPNK